MDKLTNYLVSGLGAKALRWRVWLVQVFCSCMLLLGVCTLSAASDFIAPVIQITENISPGEAGTELNILNVNIRDTEPLISANLLFRERGSTRDYSYVPLMKVVNVKEGSDQGSNRFSYTGVILKDDILSGEIEVYVEVLDSRGNRSQYPPAENPLQLLALHHAVRRGFPSKPVHWVGIGLGAVALIAAIAGASSSGGSPSSSSPSLTITAPVPE